jgi:hypothetical protein
MRKVGTSSCARDPLGAGQYVFSFVRWLNPDDAQDSEILARGLDDFFHRFHHLRGALSPSRLADVLRRVVCAWRTSLVRSLAPFCSDLLLPVNQLSSKDLGTRRPSTEICMPAMQLPCPNLDGQPQDSYQTSSGIASKLEPASPPPHDGPRLPSSQLTATPPPPAHDPPLLAQPPPPPCMIDSFLPHPRFAPSAVAAHAHGPHFTAPSDLTGGHRAAPRGLASAGWCCGAADEWAVDLPPASDPGGAWATFDALLPHILRSCA